jgi:hypothetical protein
MTHRYMRIDRALAYMRSHRVFLCYDAERVLDLWTPGIKVPISLRRTIVKHRQELLAMMHSGAREVCPSPQLHQQYSQGQVCSVCKRLNVT